MQKDLISVIVPIYNVEQYLNKCISSIINQTYKNLEIILVDDGSPDNCPFICDDFANKDKRIKVIHKKNGGLSDARNAGIELASGKYLCFVDSDDYIHETFVDILYNNLISSNSDISICGFQKVFENRKSNTLQNNNSYLEIFNNEEILSNFYNKGMLFIVAWNKLYKTSLFKSTGIRYPVGKIHEDEFIAHHVLSKCNRICFCHNPLYFYLIRPNSIMGQNKTEKHLYVFDALNDRCKFFKNINCALYINALSSYISTLTCLYFEFKKELKPTILSILKNFQKEYKADLKKIPKKMKLKLFLFLHARFLLKFRCFYKYSKKENQ